MAKAAQAEVPAPELVAYDEGGDCCGVPATLMTLLPGRVDLKPANIEGWLRQLAGALIRIHALDADDFAWSYFPYNDISRLEAPSWSQHPGLWERAIEVVNGPPPESRQCFIHRDYHPNNVLWQGGRLSGVVDWVNACRGAAGIDVAWCRQNLAQMYGVAEANLFLSAYESVAGEGFEYKPYWDLIAAIELLPGPPGMYEGWSAFGMRPLEKETIRERVDAYLASLVARL